MSLERSATHDVRTSSTKATLLSLPAEIRNEIYRLVVVDPERVFLSPRFPASCQEPVLLRVNRQVRSEVLPMYYGLNCFASVSLPLLEKFIDHATIVPGRRLGVIRLDRLGAGLKEVRKQATKLKDVLRNRQVSVTALEIGVEVRVPGTLDSEFLWVHEADMGCFVQSEDGVMLRHSSPMPLPL